MRFQTKLILLFALLFAVALIVRTALTYKLQKKQTLEITSDIRKIVSVVHFATQRLSSEKDRDREALNSFIKDAVLQHDALKRISVVNVQQEIIASSDSSIVGTSLSEADLLSSSTDGFHKEDTLEYYDITIPIVKNRKIIGKVLASVALSDVSESFSELNYKNILITLFLFASVSIVSFLMIGRITKPMKKLVTAAQRIAQGDLDIEIDLKADGNDEQAVLTAAFKSMIQKLQEVRKIEIHLRNMERHVILSETAATLAHEIRNPLNYVNLAAGRLAHKFLPGDQKLHDEYLSVINDLKSQVKYINDMVNDFLAVGKPLKLHKSQLFLIDLIRQIEMIIKPQIIAKGISIINDFSSEVTITADIEQIRLVLLNLILNAVELTENNGVICISFDSTDDCNLIKVTDNGPGIPSEDLEKIFEPYYTKRIGGTGLGLTLARRIVDEHGGKIWADNLQPGGACFTISLPRSEFV